MELFTLFTHPVPDHFTGTFLFLYTANNPLIFNVGYSIYRINGVAPSKDDVGFQRTRLLKPRQQPKRLKTNEDPPRSLLIANVQLNILAQETTYYCRVVRLPQHFIRKHHVIQVFLIIKLSSSFDCCYHIIDFGISLKRPLRKEESRSFTIWKCFIARRHQMKRSRNIAVHAPIPVDRIQLAFVNEF